MHGFFSSLFLLFLSPVGLVVLSALDTSMVFYLPLAVEGAVVILTARHRELVWLFPILAAAGSTAGAFVTFKIGAKIGEEGLKRWIPDKRIRPIQQKLKKKGALPLATTALLPPPFPLSPILLACGALKVKASLFLIAFGVARLIRFSIVGVLAWLYGDWIVRVIESAAFRTAIMIFIVIAIAGTVYSIYRIRHHSKGHRPAKSTKARHVT